jgi:hypothetical protein
MVNACGAHGLGAWDQVSCYCERAFDSGFWAEPLNAMSNIAFLIAAVMAYADLRAARPGRGGGAIITLILLMMVIGIGSFLFHTLATVWARAADVIPIAVFTFAYMALALQRLVGLGAVLSFVLAVAVAVASQVMPPWFAGSSNYAPSLLSMLIVGLALAAREHPGGRWILAAGGVFFVSLVLRTIDGGAGCFTHPPGAAEPQFAIGTHPFWHILNAVTLYLLLRALIDAPARPAYGRARERSPA